MLAHLVRFCWEIFKTLETAQIRLNKLDIGPQANPATRKPIATRIFSCQMGNIAKHITVSGLVYCTDSEPTVQIHLQVENLIIIFQ